MFEREPRLAQRPGQLPAKRALVLFTDRGLDTITLCDPVDHFALDLPEVVAHGHILPRIICWTLKILGREVYVAPPHQHEREPDPRWAALSELRFE